MGRKSSKDAILDAADRVIKRQGLAAATIDAVAHEAGVSKGGLFYHFATKREMLLRLIDRYEELFQRERDRIFASLPDTPARLLKATIIASVKHPARIKQSVTNFLALLDDVELRERICDIKRKVFDEILAESGRPETVAVALLATDGLWVAEMFGRKSFSEAFRRRIVAELLKLIDVHEMDLARGERKRSC